ncbi:uncharacterized protein LOC124915211 [Impatiens glandulifera]|uniref:uncharacterized protein LOC124915211 n=1 Tax=Impatiens glandulifera TaxID=253017 RepID=UPI001FB0E9EE|nr:uncharacterized protein LOC124915211 [Impatiens glandulifera]
MSKKMKGVSYYPSPSPYRVFEDPNPRLNHQVLIQDYQELQKETKSIKNRLDNTKERKLVLLAEVRFLQRRYKQLLRTKHDNNLGVQQQQQKKTQNERIHIRNEASLHRRAIQNVVAFKKEMKILDGKGSPQQQLPPPLTPPKKNKQRRIGGKKAMNSSLGLKKPILDLNQKGEAPVFDLNQIAREDNDEADYFCPVTIDESRKNPLSRMEDQLKFQQSCRNMGNGNRAGKMKADSWQDPVVLKV